MPTNEIEYKLSNIDYIKSLHNNRFRWSLYEINSNILWFEYYRIFAHDWHTCIAHCVILNYSTFNI